MNDGIYFHASGPAYENDHTTFVTEFKKIFYAVC